MKTTLSDISLFVVILFLPFLFWGCHSEEPFKNIVIGQQPEMFNLVSRIDRSAEKPEVLEQAGYSMTFDMDNRTANISITNLRLYSGDVARTLVFDDIPMTFTADRHEVERIVTADILTSLTPDGESVDITDATFVYTESNALDPNGTVGVYARFVIFDRYVVTAYPYEMLADGTTRITDGSGNDVIDYAPIYTIRLNPEGMTADVIVCGLTVAGEKLSPVVSKLDLVFTDNGYDLEQSSITKVANAEGCLIKSFSGTAMLRDELKIEFDMSLPDGKAVHVSAFLTPNLFR